MSRSDPTEPSAHRTADRATTRLLVSCVVAAAAAAVAAGLPEPVRSQAVVATLLLWGAAALAGTIAILRALASHRLGGWAALGLAGAGTATFAAIELELIRVVLARPALTWHVDWRYALSHAQAIAATGGVDAALDYAGAPINYHVGPAWFAGSFERLFGGGMTQVLFGVVPLLSMLTLGVAAATLLRNHDVPWRIGLAASGLMVTLPGLTVAPIDVYYCLQGPCRTSPWLWLFSPQLMLNSFMGMAVGISAIALLTDARAGWARALAATAGLGALVMIKPQYWVGFGIVAGLLGALGLLRSRTSRGGRMLAIALAGGVLGVLLLRALPHAEGRFAAPEWSPGATGFGLRDAGMNTALLVGVAWIAAWQFLRQHRPVRRFLLAASLALVALAATWYVVQFPQREELVRRAERLGMPELGSRRQQLDLAQSLDPILSLAALAALAALAGAVAARNASRWVPALQAAGWAAALSPAIFIVPGLLAPERGHHASEDIGLLRVLGELPSDGTLAIASDLADPAEDYSRALRGLELTAFTGRAFFVSNLVYSHYMWPDSDARLMQLRAFFGSGWSAWHSAWLAHGNIGTILVDDRCPPRWLGERGVPLRAVSHHGRWTAFSVAGKAPAGAAASDPPAWEDITPRYGRANCLFGTEPVLRTGDVSARRGR